MAGPTQKEIDEAIEKSRLYLEEQQKPPADAHPKPTTPTQAEIEAALELSADYLEKQGYKVTRDGYEPPPAAASPTSVSSPSVSFAGTQTAPDSPPVDDSRDKSQDSDKMVAKDNATTTAKKD